MTNNRYTESTMKYISSRGQQKNKDFLQVLLTGLADDGGLYVPEFIPEFSVEKIRSLKGLSYQKLAFEIIQPFVGGTIADDVLRQMINDSYADVYPSISGTFTSIRY